MPYLMGGFPDLDATVAIGAACADDGADLVELGVPFSDPLADGPVIHAAGTRALAAGATLRGVLERRHADRRAAAGGPHVLREPRLRTRGRALRGRARRSAGVSGLIVPDLPLGEDGAVRDACDAAGLALVPLIAPTTPDDRMAEIARRARGFLYTVSVTGTTGERASVDRSLASRARAREARLPGPGRRRLRHLDPRAGGRGGRRRRPRA